MRLVLTAAAALALAGPARAFWGSGPGFDARAEDEAFNAAAQQFPQDGRDRLAVIQAFESFVAEFPRSPRRADAQFLIGEAQMQRARALLKADAQKKTGARPSAARNPAAAKALDDARRAFEAVLGEKKSGLAASAQYRLGETAYDLGDWDKAVAAFTAVADDHPKSYVNPEALIGIVYADLALEQFTQAESNLFLLGEQYPTFLREPAVLYAQGIVDLHKGAYPDAERSFKDVRTDEAQYYLGKTYLLSRRAYLAAAAFENLIRDYPDSDLKEEAQFFIGDSFFLSQDYNGAIAKYRKFIALYPSSPLRVAALFRIGASYFELKDYVEARAGLQTAIDRAPKDFFAPLAQLFIAESFLASGQPREALFAFTKVLTQYPDAIKIAPLAAFKLAWCQNQVGDYGQSVQTASSFAQQFPSHPLAKDVYMVMADSLVRLKHYPEAISAYQRVIDIAPNTETAEQALFLILKSQYDQKAFNSILTSYQFIFRRLPPSRSKWRSLSYLYAADAYLALNQVDEAKVLYEMILKVYPDDAAALYAQDGLAWCYSYKGDDAGALDARRKLKDMMTVATSSAGFSGGNELGIADSLFNQKSYDDAYTLYAKFAADYPSSPQAPAALYRAAMCSYHQRYYSQAIDLWGRLIALYPNAKDAPQARAQRADTLFRAQKYAQAADAYRGLLTADPKGDAAPQARLRLAQCAFEQKDDAGAVSEVRALVAAFPNAPEATDGLDVLDGVFDRSRSFDYRATWRAVAAAAPGTSIAGEAQFRLARREFEAKDYAAAAAEFQKFSVDFTNHPELPKAQFLLAESELQLKRYADAAQAYERLLANFDKNDDFPAAVFHLAGAYFAQDKFADAARVYARLLEEYPDSDYSSPALYNQALCYQKLGKLDLAQYAFQKYAAEAKPGDAQADDALWATFQIEKDRKDFDAAIGTLARIRRRPGADVLEAWYREGELRVEQGRPDAALAVWERMRGLKPAGSRYRLQALIELGKAYEKMNDNASAADVYAELARVGPKDTAKAAAARAAALRKLAGSAKPRPRPKPADDAAAAEDDGTMVMPADAGDTGAAAPEPAAPDKAAKKKSAVAEPSLPGMSDSGQ